VHEAQGWRLQVLEPAIEDLAMIPIFNEGLLRSMLIAFPSVLLPLWLAVRRGLVDRARNVDLVEEVRALLVAAAPRGRAADRGESFNSPDRLALS
jgi:hypothetical protein